MYDCSTTVINYETSGQLPKCFQLSAIPHVSRTCNLTIYFFFTAYNQIANMLHSYL